jgi:hypothetical protein
MEVNSVPEKRLTGTLDNFESSSTAEASLYREAIGDETLRFSSREESYTVEGFGYLNI